MNTVKSVYYGWATLIVAGGGAYFFAKRSINADRAAKAEADRQKRARNFELEYNHFHGSSKTSSSTTTSAAAHAAAEGSLNPSIQASQDPAPAPSAPKEQGAEKSKYEASEVFRSRKGDRFS